MNWFAIPHISYQMSILVAEWLLLKYEWATRLLRQGIAITQLFQQKKPQSNDWGFYFFPVKVSC
ncbi:hypothetical protein VDIAB_230066 [Vibrio diabolicus]|nr:hypothetical protein VDIAB_230066 [Vibrio diabolicus]